MSGIIKLSILIVLLNGSGTINIDSDNINNTYYSWTINISDGNMTVHEHEYYAENKDCHEHHYDVDEQFVLDLLYNAYDNKYNVSLTNAELYIVYDID